MIVTSKAAFDKYGRETADKEHMMGGGPYRLKELIPGQRRYCKNGRSIRTPKKIRARQTKSSIALCAIRARVTALLTDEIQIAQFIPPHLRQRVEKTRDSKDYSGGFGRNHVSRHAAETAV